MKSKHLLLTLLLALFVPWAANAQETVTIGDGTVTSNTNPIGTYYNYSITEQLYTAEEIGTAGTISSISFYYMGNAAKELPITVYMKHVDEENLASAGISLADADEVFSGTLPVTTTAGWVTINLATPFDYDGTSNLLIGFIKDYLYYFSGQSWQGTATTTTMARYTQSDSAGPYTTSTVPGTAQTNRPNIQLVITPAAGSCTKPSTFEVSNVTAFTANFTWENTGAASYTFEVKEAAESEWLVFNGIESNAYTLTGLNSETAYNARMKAVCGTGSESGYKTVNFTTEPSCYVPTGLTVTDVSAYMATISWTDTLNSGADTWQICFNNDETDLMTTHVTTNPVGGLTPETTYNVKVRTVCGEDDYSQWTSNVSFTTAEVCPEGMVCIGQGTATSNYVPANNYYKYSLTEQIYTAAEIGEAGAIYSIDFYKASTNAMTRTLNIYMVNTTKDEFTSNSDWITVTASDLVYSGSVTFADNDWTTIELDNPFIYDGTNNVCLVVDDNTGSYANNTPFRVFTAAKTQTIYQQNDNTNLDPTAASVGSASGRQSTKNRIRLNIGEPPACPKPTGLTTFNVTAHEASVAWTSDASAFEIQLGEGDAIPCNDTAYHFTGLTAETTYSVKVRTNCGGTYSDWTNPVSFTTGIACPAPTDLDAALTPGNGSIATLSWTSSASAWVVAYKTADDEEFTEVNVTENPYTLTGLTPETAYTAKVKAVCGGIDGESQWSSTVTFTPTDAYALTVNDGTTTNSYVPVYGTWVDSYTKCQFIIPASELVDMQYGNISKMTFYSSTQNKTWGAAEFDILLAEVDNTTFESATLVDWADMDQVYHGAVSISDYKMEIVFDNDYQYMGGNLLVGFHQTVKGTYGGISWYGVSSTNSAIGGYENSAKALSLQSFLPKTTFDYVPGEAPACLKPTNLSVNYEGGITATVTWEGTATSYNIDVNGTVIEGVTSPYTLEGLELATTYTVMVQANCGEDLSDWTNAASFTTDLCMPENQCELTFVLTDSYGDGWNGAYIDVVDVATGESLAHMSNQNLSKGDPETETYTLTVCDGRELQFVWYSGSYDSEASYVVTDINGEEIFSGSGAMSEPVNYTVNCTPITCFRPTDVEVAYITNDAATVQWNGTSDSYQVQYRTLNGEWTTIETENLAAELTDLAANTTYEYQVRGFCDADSTYSDWTSMATFTTLDICTTPEDLVVTSGANSATATWTGVQDSYNVYWRLSSETEYTHSTSVNATNYTIEGLQSGQSYSVKVEGVCTNGVSDAIEETFSTALLWTDPEVWNNPENPNYSGDPEQNAPEVITVTENTVVVIPENASIEVNQIVMENGSEIIIEEGGELAYTVDDPTDPNAAAQGIDVTMSMTITPSGAKSGTDYRLIASPIYQTIDVVDCGLTENYYGMDLYSFDASYPGAEWRNYKTNDNFDNLEIGKGYLYYNDESVFVTFYGQTVPSNVIYPINLAWNENVQDNSWKGLNLIGNPFTCKAVPSKPFFVLNDAGNEIITTASTAAYVAPMRGFFVVAENASDNVCNVTKYDPNNAKSALNMTVSQNDDLVDVAVVNFSKGENLRKVQLNPNHTKIYMPVEGNDYAVANAESNAGEMPVNFKAEHNGSYTLNFGIDNVNFNYLHLIDNMTGADVDLLATPYYTFNANSTDYASRFKLVYATGDNSNDDNFAFFNNGNIIINNDGEAMLQVVDVMGRILKSESINGSTSVNLNVAPGVYMLRLINGNDMKVQKMIVK